MEFENVHEEVADLRSRVEKLEARLETADQVAHAVLADIKEHDVETEPAVPVVNAETHDDGEVTSHDAQDGHVSGQE